MEYDLIISGGTVIDGSGAQAIKADIAISNGRIQRIGNLGDAQASKTLDATGKMVTPGFVDLHTHLDAQIGWDPMMSSSSYHGVTTAMIGNCGVTFAPCRPKNRRYLAELMESVEDIAADAIMDGLPWDWTSYGEYLDSVQSLQPALNVVGLAGHSAVRYEAMGDRSCYEAGIRQNMLANSVCWIIFLQHCLVGVVRVWKRGTVCGSSLNSLRPWNVMVTLQTYGRSCVAWLRR